VGTASATLIGVKLPRPTNLSSAPERHYKSVLEHRRQFERGHLGAALRRFSSLGTAMLMSAIDRDQGGLTSQYAGCRKGSG